MKFGKTAQFAKFTKYYLVCHTHTPTHAHTHTHACTHTHIHTYTCTYTNAHTYTHNTRTHIHKHTHIHTHTHIPIDNLLNDVVISVSFTSGRLLTISLSPANRCCLCNVIISPTGSMVTLSMVTSVMTDDDVGINSF